MTPRSRVTESWIFTKFIESFIGQYVTRLGTFEFCMCDSFRLVMVTHPQTNRARLWRNKVIDNATWCNTTPHSYTDGQRRTNYYWEFIHINSENFFVEQLLRNTNHRGYGSGTPPQKLGDWKGGSDESHMEKCGSDGEAGIRLHVACILLVRVLGQNVTGQNVTDTMSWTKYYEDKMLLVKMSRHFVHNIFSTTYFQRHFVQWHFVNITFCLRYFVRWHLVRPPL